jgi:hypothetical protein
MLTHMSSGVLNMLYVPTLIMLLVLLPCACADDVRAERHSG